MKKFYEIGSRLVQVDRFGVWHGYIGCDYKTSFSGEADAVKWLNSKEGAK